MLELQNITKRYGDRTILTDINLSIAKGEIVSILGPSGCGKTTLLNLILGLTDATSGRLIYDGEDLTDVPMEKRGFNIVFQDYALFPNLNARENITYGLRNFPDRSTPAEVDEMIDLLGLRKHLDQRIDSLSGGQKQRVALARTLVMKPRLLLLDEPLSALDGLIKESIKDRIKTIARQLELTTLIQMFETFFINSMVTISAIVFLTSTRTMVLTTRIKELQYFERFDAIFVLSLLIFITNVAAKLVLDYLAQRSENRSH